MVPSNDHSVHNNHQNNDNQRKDCGDHANNYPTIQNRSKMALVLDHAVCGSNDRGNAQVSIQIHDILATNGNHESLVQIYHSYTYSRVSYDNLGIRNYLCCDVKDDRIQENQLS
jgi:hypothetical protein